MFVVGERQRRTSEIHSEPFHQALESVGIILNLECMSARPLIQLGEQGHGNREAY